MYRMPDAGGKPPGRGFTIAAWIMGAIAFLFVPIVFGVLGIVFGAVAKSKGDPIGQRAMIFSIVGLAVGIALGALFFRAYGL